MGSMTKPGFGAASGFANLESVMNSPLIHGELLDDLRCEVIFDSIFSTKYYSELTCGTTVLIRTMPKVDWHTLIPNQDLEMQQLEVCDRPLYIGYAEYANLKLDDMAQEYICNYGRLEDAWKQQAMLDAKEIVERTVFETLYFEAHEHNRGANAGTTTGMYNLGEIGAPYPLNGTTFITLLTYMSNVLGEQCIPESDRFVIFPDQAKLAFINSPLVNAELMGSCVKCSPLKTGMYYENMFGFNVHFSHFLRPCKDAIDPSKTTYFVLFGHKDSLAYTMSMSLFEYVTLQNAFGKAVRVRLTFGAGAYRPEGLGYAYVEIDNNNPFV